MKVGEVERQKAVFVGWPIYIIKLMYLYCFSIYIYMYIIVGFDWARFYPPFYSNFSYRSFCPTLPPPIFNNYNFKSSWLDNYYIFSCYIHKTQFFLIFRVKDIIINSIKWQKVCTLVLKSFCNLHSMWLRLQSNKKA